MSEHKYIKRLSNAYGYLRRHSYRRFLWRIKEEMLNMGAPGVPFEESLEGHSVPSILLRKAFHQVLRIPGVESSLADLFPGENDLPGYTDWLYRYGIVSPRKRAAMEQAQAQFELKPLISVLLPTYKSNLVWLGKAVESVQRQVYPNWELCISDDASNSPELTSYLENLSHFDPRIKVVYRETNGHISASSNSALEIAEGEYIALLDHDDEFSPDALFWVAKTINAHPDAKILYSDEDKISESGKRRGPYFKSDFNYDLFLGQNMISHLGAYQTELVRSVDGFRVGTEGSQDWDLALRCMDVIDHKEILHIPRVLYHWRVHRDSTAAGSAAKPYALLAGQRVVQDHLDRKHINAHAELHPQIDHIQVVYALPEVFPLVSIIIPTRNAKKYVRRCIESLTELTNYKNYEIILVDNDSDDPDALEYFDALVDEGIVRKLDVPEPFNYSRLNNLAAKAARGEFLLLLNNDIEVTHPEWLGEMVSIGLQPGVGAVGAKLWYPNDTLQHGGVILGVGGVAAHFHRELYKGDAGYFGRASLRQQLSAVTGACMLIRKSIYEEVGGLDEEELKVTFNDVDFCIRVSNAGYRNIFTPFAELIHYESVSRGLDATPERKARFESEVKVMRRRWADLLDHDPFYNPNLTLDTDAIKCADVPRYQD